MSILRTQEDNMVACQNYILDGSDISHFHILRWKKTAGLVEKIIQVFVLTTFSAKSRNTLFIFLAFETVICMILKKLPKMSGYEILYVIFCRMVYIFLYKEYDQNIRLNEVRRTLQI